MSWTDDVTVAKIKSGTVSSDDADTDCFCQNQRYVEASQSTALVGSL
jgi:hypothetical protein